MNSGVVSRTAYIVENVHFGEIFATNHCMSPEGIWALNQEVCHLFNELCTHWKCKNLKEEEAIQSPPINLIITSN
ncbi:hypothetical protein VCRA2133E348_970008 [Vibrio crassostreae]|nr:hypothetical protein VCRA2133E348_970008 [Vibrio crassostreae]CAK3660842.1 hypothetical protein VCRA213O314_820001 [Vibrio crassostreae]